MTIDSHLITMNDEPSEILEYIVHTGNQKVIGDLRHQIKVITLLHESYHMTAYQTEHQYHSHCITQGKAAPSNTVKLYVLCN